MPVTAVDDVSSWALPQVPALHEAICSLVGG
jgi:hypothetical protein